MTLGELVRAAAGSRASPATRRSAIAVGDRTTRARAGPGALFVAIRGLGDRRQPVRGRGAQEGRGRRSSPRQPPRRAAPWVQVPDAREALAAALGRRPRRSRARRSTLVGVTGTNGKTTTTYLIDAALRAAGHTVGLLGTVQYRIGDRAGRGRAHDARVLRPAGAVPRDGGRRLPPRGARGLVALAGAEARPRLRVPGRGLHEPDPRPPRLPRRHGRATSRPSGCCSTRCCARTDTPIVNADDDRAAELAARRARHASGPTASTSPARPRGRGRSRSRSTARASACRTPAGDLEVRDAARRPLQRAEPAGRPRRRRSRSASTRDAPLRGLATLTGVPGRLERVDGGPGLHGDRRLRPHRRRAQEPAGDGARAEAAAASSPCSAAAATATAPSGR